MRKTTEKRLFHPGGEAGANTRGPLAVRPRSRLAGSPGTEAIGIVELTGSVVASGATRI